MKSRIDWPTRGLTNAVQKPQNAAQSKTGLSGLNKTIPATTTSLIPTSNNSVPAVLGSAPVNWLIQPIQSFFPPIASRPWPKNSPATPTRSIHSIFLSLLIFVSLVFLNLIISPKGMEVINRVDSWRKIRYDIV